VFSPVRSFLKAFILWQIFQSMDVFSVSPYSTGVWLFVPLATSIIFSILLKKPTELIYGVAMVAWVSFFHRFNGFFPLLYFVWSFYRLDKMYSQDSVQIDESKLSEALEYGGFWRRGVAYIIDWCILILFVIPVSVAVGGLNADVQPVNSYHQLINVVLVLVIWLILSMMESSVSRATLGKRALGLRVVDLSGNRLSFTTALMRNFIKLPLLGVPKYFLPESEWVFGILFVGQVAIFCTVIFSRKKQTVYDMLVKTLVVR